MSDLNPTEIYGRYERKELDKAAAVGYLKSIIESGSKAESRVRSMEYLAKLELNKPKDFAFLESLVTSDTNKDIRLTSAQIIINKFLEEGENLLKWMFKNEKSPDCLLGVYNTFTSKDSTLAKDLFHIMEETIGMYYLIHYDLLPKEAMALELLGKHLCKLSVYRNLTKWNFTGLKIKNQKVISIEIEKLDKPINSKFFGLFFDLQELKLFDCKLKNVFNLRGISSLMITGTEEGQLDTIDEIKNLDNLTSLKTLNLSKNNLSEITNLGKLTNLVELDLSQNFISEIKGLETLRNLEYLNLEHNEITEIKNLENLVNLRELNLSDNKDIPEIKGLKKLKSLEILKLYNNFLIKEIKGLEGLENLRLLDISKDSFMIDKEGYEFLLKMRLDFSPDGGIKKLIANENDKFREKLEKYRRCITELKGLDTLANLRKLFLEGNQIREIKGLEKLEKLELLDLRSNKIKDIKGLENLKNLKTLRLAENNILPIEGLEGIENDLGVYNPQKFVEYCENKKKS